MSHLKKPYDRETAYEVMKKFSGMAYSLVNKSVFQAAVNILYGPEFTVTVDLSKRMQFSCQICNREMNSETAMKEHHNSGGHQKNLDKRTRDAGISNYNTRAMNYAKDSIHFRLLNSHVAPVGLQMIEEYINRRGSIYFKCILCGAHGKLEIMYQHVIGKKHTERYIKSCCVLENSILNPNERETLRQMLVKDEGVNVDAIRTIKGDEYYPYKWEREGVCSTKFNRKIKREPQEADSFKIKSEGGVRHKFNLERRSSSGSPTPGPSRGRSRSISPPKRYYTGSPCKREHGRQSPSLGRHSRSPSWRRNSGSPSRRRHSRSPSKRRVSPSPASTQRRSRSLSRQRSRHWSRSSTSSSERSLLPSPKERKPEVPLISVRTSGDLSAYRNRSPSPPVQIKPEPVSPPIRIKEEPQSPSASTDYTNSMPMPVAVSAIKKEKSDATTQTKLNLENLMMHINEFNKTHLGKPLRNSEEVKLAIDTMNCYANTIRNVVLKVMEDGTAKSPEKMRMLQFQKEKIEKVIGYITKWYLPTWQREIQKQ